MDTPRWHLRLDNFLAALASLEASARLASERELSELEKAGFVQQFEVCWEAGWKVMRDYLCAAGSPVDVPVPRNVIRAAFDANVISDGDMWVEAMKARNVMSHDYDCSAFGETVIRIGADFVPLLVALRAKLIGERDAGN
ncbi:nucleotidyltransferase substrate binding protein [Sphingomonas sp. SUN039]|uniref:nucleotidyltransferase substrate binding protein n=1 Tax=Sphingomonas sp. SUN039 TaxID=2937787 RepID=UPI00216495E5|nr:nucleotidyltransferase substrate binding protein [Sphingomonas sp. SUN039]UVO54191.1 nucleotidyltransferase substrate binding protein [Sphingomonas sp. SUN039]